MDAQKTKKDLYLQKLEKWRLEKQMKRPPLAEKKVLNKKRGSGKVGDVKKPRLSQVQPKPNTNTKIVTSPSLPATKHSQVSTVTRPSLSASKSTYLPSGKVGDVKKPRLSQVQPKPNTNKKIVTRPSLPATKHSQVSTVTRPSLPASKSTYLPSGKVGDVKKPRLSQVQPKPNTNTKIVTRPSLPATKHSQVSTVTRPSLPASKSTYTRTQRRFTVLPSSKRTSFTGLTNKKKTENEVVQTKAVRKPVSKDEEASMLDRLQKWREEKGASTTKTKVNVQAKKGDTKQDSQEPKFKEVKSRLFDFMGTKKPVSKPRDTNTNTHVQKKSVVNKLGATSNKLGATSNKPGQQQVKTNQSVHKKAPIKRRHSEVIKTQPAKHLQPASILKRKSCVGFVHDDAEEAVKQDYIGCAGDQPFDHLGVEPVTPGTARSVRFKSPTDGRKNDRCSATFRKTPARPKKTQSMMMEQLSSWLDAKGRTPSKFRHLSCFDAEMKSMKELDPQANRDITVDQLKEQLEVLEYEAFKPELMSKLKSIFDECTSLAETDYPTADILAWLDQIYTQMPALQTCAQFYTCKATILASTLDLDAILSVFETALVNQAKPLEDVAASMTEVIKQVTEEREKQTRSRSRTRRKSEIQPENVFQSSSIVYSVTKAPSLFKRSKSRDRESSPSDSCSVATPVRRSTRKSLQNLPASLRDRRTQYTTLDDVDPQTKNNMLFQPNMALESLFDQCSTSDD